MKQKSDKMSQKSTVHCFDSGYMGKQQAARKEYCAEYWLKEHR